MSDYTIDRAAFRQAMQFLGIPTAGLMAIRSTPLEIRATYQVRNHEGYCQVVGSEILKAEAVFRLEGLHA